MRSFACPLARQSLTPHRFSHREGAGHETGLGQVWDPLGLADLGSPATLAWMRHAELKHGRVCMAAFLGWLIATGNQLAVQNGHDGLHFPGLISFSEQVSFADIAAAGGPLEQWQTVPELGKLQILSAIFLIEHQSEWKIKPHYMAPGGKPGCAPPHRPHLLRHSHRRRLRSVPTRMTLYQRRTRCIVPSPL